MLTVLILCILIACVAIVACIAPVIGWRAFLAAGLVGALCLVPVRIIALPAHRKHFGITGPTFELSTYGTVIIIAGVCVCMFFGLRSFASSFLLGAFLIVGMIFLWDRSTEQWAGVELLLLGSVALVVGRFVGRKCVADSRMQFWIALTAATAFAIQFFLCALQIKYPSFSLAPTDATFGAEGRSVGTFTHPGMVGKVGLLMMPILLPLCRSQVQHVRQSATAATVFAIAASCLTLSRANVIGLVLLLLLWAILTPGLRTSRRIAVAFGVSLAGAVGVAMLIGRFQLDPEGGDRGVLLATGLAQIARAPLSGIGPNSYSEVVGAFDVLAASGYPVHNAFLLAVAELGMVGAAILFFPLISTFRLALRERRERTFSGFAAVAFLAGVPAVLLVGLTGWGLLAEGSFVLWMFSVGFSSGAICTPNFMRVRNENLGYGAGSRMLDTGSRPGMSSSTLSRTGSTPASTVS